MLPTLLGLKHPIFSLYNLIFLFLLIVTPLIHKHMGKATAIAKKLEEAENGKLKYFFAPTPPQAHMTAIII